MRQTVTDSRKWLRPAIIIIAAVILIAVVLIVRPPDTSPDLEELAAMAESIETLEVQSYRSTWLGTSTNRGIATESSHELAFTTPDRYHLKTMDDGVVREFIAIGDAQYVRSGEISSSLIRVSTQSAANFLTPKFSLGSLESLVEPEELKPETINGVKCFHYSGTVDLERQWKEMVASVNTTRLGHEEWLEMMEAELERARKSTIEYEIWIGKEDLLTRQLKYSGRVPSKNEGQWDTANTTIRLYDINQPVTIEPPLDASGGLLVGWYLAKDYTPGIGFEGELAYEITGEDPVHRQVSLTYTVTNAGIATAGNVTVILDRIITPGYEEGPPWVDTVPSTPGPVDLAPGQSETFSGSYTCNTSRADNWKFNEMVRTTKVRITYITPDGHEKSKIVVDGAPYPTAVPPGSTAEE